jgi:hypothetical protein
MESDLEAARKRIMFLEGEVRSLEAENKELIDALNDTDDDDFESRAQHRN